MRFNSTEQLFVFDRNKWTKMCATDCCLHSPATTAVVKNGILLPLRKRTDVAVMNFSFEGGVCDETGKFVAGITRNLRNPSTNLSCSRAYPIPPHVQVRQETVVFGGILYQHFGHFMIDSLTRLWWFAEHSDTEYKLVFLLAKVTGEPFRYEELFDLAGISEDRLEIITEATQFEQIIVPEETLYIMSNYKPEMRKIYEHIQARVTPEKYKKIYLSREKLAKQDIVNERYFSDFYRRRGYTIVYPEQLPLETQIAILSGAEEIVAIEGTLISLAALFCREHARIVCLTRSDEILNIVPILQGSGAQYYIVDTQFSFLQGTSGGVYFIGPTLYWKKYLDSAGIDYKPEEVSFDLYVKPYLYEYIEKWSNLYYTNAGIYKNIHNKSLIDVVDSANRVFFNRPIDRKSYADRDEIAKLKRENAELKNRIDILEDIFKAALADAQKPVSDNSKSLESQKELRADWDEAPAPQLGSLFQSLRARWSRRKRAKQ